MEPRNITDYHDTSRHTDEENMAFCVKLFSDLIENTPGCQNDLLLELVSDARKWEQLRRGIRDLNAWLSMTSSRKEGAFNARQKTRSIST